MLQGGGLSFDAGLLYVVQNGPWGQVLSLASNSDVTSPTPSNRVSDPRFVAPSTAAKRGNEL
jgi:hypothetical protein